MRENNIFNGIGMGVKLWWSVWVVVGDVGWVVNFFFFQFPSLYTVRIFRQFFFCSACLWDGENGKRKNIIWNITHSGERDRKSNGRDMCGVFWDGGGGGGRMRRKNDAEGRGIVVVAGFSSYICRKISQFFSSPSSIYFYKKFISVFTINFFIFTRHGYVCVCMCGSVRMWKTSIYLHIHINYIICIIIIRFFFYASSSIEGKKFSSFFSLVFHYFLPFSY